MTEVSGGAPEFRKSARTWAVLIGCCIMSAIGFSVPVTGFSVMAKPIIATTGCSVAEVMLYSTAMAISSIVIFAVGGKLFKLGAGKNVAIAGIVGGFAFIFLAAFPSVQMIVVAGLMVGLSYPMTSIYAAPIVVNQWFYKKQGTFTAIVLAFIGVGGAILSPVMTAMIASMGWQTTMVIWGIVLIVVQVCVGAFLICTSPLPLGILPYGATKEDVRKILDGAGKQEDPEKLPGLTLRESFTTPVFWLMAVVFICFGVMAVVTPNVNTMVQVSGFSAMVAGFAVSCSSIGNIVGKLVMGWVKDKKGAAWATAAAALMAVAGFSFYIAAFTSMNEIMVYVGAFIGGCGVCMATMMPPLVASDAFGPRAFAVLYGLGSTLRAIAGGIGSPAAGAIYGSSGSYVPNLLIWIVFAIVAVPFAFIGIKAGQKRWDHPSQK